MGSAVAVVKRGEAGDDGSLSRPGGNGRRVGVFEEHPLAGKTVHGRACCAEVAIATQMVRAQGVDANQNNVGFRRGESHRIIRGASGTSLSRASSDGPVHPTETRGRRSELCRQDWCAQSSTLETGQGNALDDPPLQQQEDDYHRDHRDGHSSHYRSLVRVVFAHEHLTQAQRQSEALLVGEHDQGPEETVPASPECKDAQCDFHVT